MSAIIGNINLNETDMASMYTHDEELRRRLAEVVRNRKDGDYSHRTAYTPSRKTDDEIKISVLTEENEKLKKQYADLVKKANLLVEAYRKLEAENETLKKKKAKTESYTNVIADAKKFAKKCVDKTIEWFNT